MYYRLVLCGLLSVYLIVGYSQPLLAAELTSDVVQEEEVQEEEVLEEELQEEEVQEEEVQEEELQEEEVQEEEVQENEIDLEDSEVDGEDNLSEESVSSSSSDSSIDYDYLQDVIVSAIQEAETTSLEAESYDGTISSTYLSLFTGIYLKYASPTDDYLCYRADQYTYNIVIGNLTVTNTTFSGSDCVIVSVYTRTATGYTPTYTVYTDDILITADNYYCYSNLGDFAPLPELAELVYQQQIVFALIFVGLMIFIHGLIVFRKGE